MNQKNLLGLDSCFMDFDDPLELFKIWMSEAEKNEINDPNAFSLATTNKKNEPSVRMILLKGLILAVYLKGLDKKTVKKSLY